MNNQLLDLEFKARVWVWLVGSDTTANKVRADALKARFAADDNALREWTKTDGERPDRETQIDVIRWLEAQP